MQQIAFKRKFSVLFDAVKTENVPHLEEKIRLIKKNIGSSLNYRNTIGVNV